MHPALLIDEILLNIFGYCYGGDRLGPDPELPRLARTCRAFREPALDVLWRELSHLNPLVRCLPEAWRFSEGGRRLSFRLPLHEKEWGILRGYARRIRCITGFSHSDWPWLDDEAKQILANPPCSDGDPLFPNLRRLRFNTSFKINVLHLPLPSLISLDIEISALREPPSDFVMLLPESCPNVRDVSIGVAIEFSELVSDWVCLWQNLRTLQCRRVALNMHALKHLSHMSALSRLTFTIGTTLHPSASVLVFPHLRDLELHSEFLDLISSFLSSIRLPTIANLEVVNFPDFDTPSITDLRSFLPSLQTSNAPLTLQHLDFFTSSRNVNASLLSVGDLLPYKVFSDLHYLMVDVDWVVVSLSESDLLMLTSSWPRLECLHINGCFGWKGRAGITLNGLLSILQACPLLVGLSLAIDTQSYIERPSNESMVHLKSRGKFHIDVLDSAIEKPSFHAVAAFFTGIASRTKGFDGDAWRDARLVKPQGWDVWRNRWSSVFRRANKWAGHRQKWWKH